MWVRVVGIVSLVVLLVFVGCLGMVNDLVEDGDGLLVIFLLELFEVID